MSNFMFEYVHLKNYKSFNEIEFNLLDRYKKPKKFVLIYGENGSGKSNLASVFSFLSQSMLTLDADDLFEAIINNGSDAIDHSLLQRVLSMRFRSISSLISASKLIDSPEPMLIEFGFLLNGKRGRYIIQTNDSELIHERLEYVLSKNKGVYYDISKKNRRINPKIFNTLSAYNEVCDGCDKYWGKHTLLSILLHESQDKANEYIRDQIGDHFKQLLHCFMRVSCKINIGGFQETGLIRVPHGFLGDFESGTIKARDEELLDRTEKMISSFFKSISPDTDHTYYRKTFEKDNLHYQLFHTKKIAGQLRDVSFSVESTGTQNLAQILPYMLVTTFGSTVVIDEFDMGVHSALVQSIAESMYKQLEGQLIVTAHSLSLMNTSIPYDCFYVISKDRDGYKTVYPFTSIDSKLHKKSNVAKQYMDDKFGGTPAPVDINFNKLLLELGVM